MEATTGDPSYRLGGYREHPPPADLLRYVERCWVYARPPAAPAIPGRGHRVLPDPAISIGFECRRDVDGRVRDGRVVFLGPIGRPRFFAPVPGAHLEAVRIRPEWCTDLLGADPAEHEDAIRDYRDVAGARGSGGLLDRLMRTRTSAESVRVLLGCVAARAAARSPSGPAGLAHAALERVRSTRGTTVQVDRLACELGVSARHLRRTIRERTGRSAKHHHRLLRVGRAVLMADGGAGAPVWARLALTAGFYDQAHLIREFRSLVGLTPAEAHAERATQRPRPVAG